MTAQPREPSTTNHEDQFTSSTIYCIYCERLLSSYICRRNELLRLKEHTNMALPRAPSLQRSPHLMNDKRQPSLGSCHDESTNHGQLDSGNYKTSSGQSLLEYGDQYLSFKPKHDDSDPTLTLSMNEKLSPRQLPSPSPTPSPRSSSPSLVITEGSSADGDHEAEGHGHSISSSISRSFEALGGQRDGHITTENGLGLHSPRPISKMLSPHQLSDIKEEKIIRNPRRPSEGQEERLSKTREVLESTMRAASQTNGDRPRQPSLSAQEKPRRPSHSHSEKEDKDKVLKLSPEAMAELTKSPESLPMSPPQHSLPLPETKVREREPSATKMRRIPSIELREREQDIQNPAFRTPSLANSIPRPGFSSRIASTPHLGYRERNSRRDRDVDRNGSPVRRQTSVRGSDGSDFDPRTAERLYVSRQRPSRQPSFAAEDRAPEPRSPSKAEQEIPLPPLLSTYLQLELASSRPSPLYIYRPRGTEYQFESAKLKFERLVNFLYVPVMLEPAMLFGTLSCLDAWLYTFTILPLRFLKALGILAAWWGRSIGQEVRYVSGFVWDALPRFWERQRGRGDSVAGGSAAQSRATSRAVSECAQNRMPSGSGNATQMTDRRAHRPSDASTQAGLERVNEKLNERVARIRNGEKTHRRTRSIPSTLTAYHKSDILQGLVIIFSCFFLMQLDASRMYHSIRGQAAMKLYVIYNVLEVGHMQLCPVLPSLEST